MTDFEQKMWEYIKKIERPDRIALSRRFPKLSPVIVYTRRMMNRFKNFCDPKIGCKRKKDYFPCVLSRHQSLLRRRLGDSNPRLQEQKIVNLTQAIKHLDGVILPPGKVFSLWTVIGQPTRRKGYVDGMLLANGAVVEGLGGGLCQLSNFLFWIFLHAPIQVVERYHHSIDVFPDSGRTLPFGSGATIFYNYVDLKIKNVSSIPIQLKIWMTDAHLKGQLLIPTQSSRKYHIYEKQHCFVKWGKKYYRYNEIWREEVVNGQTMKDELIITNFAPVMYRVTKKYLEENDFKLVDFTGKKMK